MASGFGAKGNEGRCTPLWRNFSTCMSTADDPSECFALREDYFECLHHKKEITRRNAVEERRAELVNDKAEKLKAEIWKDVFDSSWTKVESKTKDGESEKK